MQQQKGGEERDRQTDRQTDRQRKRDRENTLLHKDKKLSKSVSAVFTNLSLDDKYSNTAERDRERVPDTG